MNRDISFYFGTFRGLAPTDESPSAMGELEVVIGDDTTHFKHATGLKIEEVSSPTHQMFKVLSCDEAKTFLNLNFDDENIDTIDVYAFGKRGVAVFTWDNPNGVSPLCLIHTGSLADMLGHTMFVLPENFPQMIDAISAEFSTPNFYPCLVDGGRYVGVK